MRWLAAWAWDSSIYVLVLLAILVHLATLPAAPIKPTGMAFISSLPPPAIASLRLGVRPLSRYSTLLHLYHSLWLNPDINYSLRHPVAVDDPATATAGSSASSPLHELMALFFHLNSGPPMPESQVYLATTTAPQVQSSPLLAQKILTMWHLSISA